MKRCTACPRHCAVDRDAGEIGYCGCGARVRVAKWMLHMWEEPCVSGLHPARDSVTLPLPDFRDPDWTAKIEPQPVRGSGAFFFCGCNLGCVYCQNRDIAGAERGIDITEERLAEIFLELAGKGAANINLVTPTHYTPQIIRSVQRARENGLKLPIVYNCSGYEKVSTLKMLDGIVDIYLTDFKYMDREAAAIYSHAPDYPEVAKAALQEMVRQIGEPVFDEAGMMKKGVIVRHLLLPNHLKNAKGVVQYVYEAYGDTVYLSLMNQYTPLSGLERWPEINRRVTKREYGRLLDYTLSLGVENAFIQEGETAKESFIPAFDCEGVLPEKPV